MLFLLSHTFFSFSFLLSLLYAPLSGKPIDICCSTDSNYTSGSTFENNLKLLLPSLTSNSSKSGFYNDTSGDRDSAYGLLLCRGDVTTDQCRICATTVTQDAVEACSGSVNVTVWEENCMLRYSDVMFFSMLNSMRSYQPNEQTISDPDEFNQVLMELLGNISLAAASRNSQRMFATGHRNFSSAQRVYGLVQCTRDLSKKNCSLCLEDAIGDIPRCCHGKQGASIFGLSCNLRYEVYPFYRESGDAGAAPPLPSPTPNAAPPGSATAGGAAPPLQSPTSRASSLAATAGGRKGRSSRTSATTFPLGIAVVLILAIAFCFLRCRKTPVTAPIDGVDQGVEGSESVQFDLESVKAATEDFSEENKLGEGGFGAVYKGRLSDGQEIAVKRLSSNSGQGVPEFKSEVALVAKLQHRNLVRLLGFCVDGQEKLLIYEYVPNKSLDRFLFDPTKRESLDWGTRYGIIGGITRGLLYLHEDSQLRIFHRDLKASNVLLDAKMNPKISDFGLAKVVGEETHITFTRVAGTYGYMAPEYAAHGKFSAKSEVFSFGVLTLEIVTGRKNNTYYESDGAEYLLSYAWERWKDGSFLELVDPTIRESCSPDEAMRCIHTALLCVQEDAADRPSMSMVLLMLNGHSTTLPAPSKPAFSISSRMALDPAIIEVNSGTGDHSNQCSTSMGPR